MGEDIHITGSEDEAGAELEWIRAQLVLLVSGGFGPSARGGVIAAKQVQQISTGQFRHLIRAPLLVDQKRKRDPLIFAENAGIIAIAQAYRHQIGALRAEFGLVIAQLRDVLAAEDSSIVAQKGYHARLLLPERAEAYLASFRIGKTNSRQFRAERSRHVSPYCFLG